MLEALLAYKFLQYALFAGLLIGFTAPILGVFMVVRRLSLIADALSHITLAGVALGLLLGQSFSLARGIDPLYFGLIFAIVGAYLIEQLRRSYKTYQELAIPVIMSAGVSLGVVLIGLGDGFNVDIFGLLFGNILAVTAEDLIRIVILSGFVLLVIGLFYKELLYLSFDEESARLSGIPHTLVNFIFSLLVALVISISMQVVGVLLVSAMIALPVAAALQISKSFRQTFLYAIIFGEFSVIVGLVIAYYFDLASGGTMVLTAVLVLSLILLGKRLGILRR